MNIQASSFGQRIIYVPASLWLRLVFDLRRRGGGHRESGAFLLGSRGQTQDELSTYVCYDDLDPHALGSGVVMLDGSAFGTLWARCRELDLEVLADVHTHGDQHPIQSSTDRVNPMVPELGHIAFILPRFAQAWGWKFQNVAIYEYQGNYRWRDWTGPKRKERVRFCW